MQLIPLLVLGREMLFRDYLFKAEFCTPCREGGETQQSATMGILAKSIYDKGATSSNPAYGFRDRNELFML